MITRSLPAALKVLVIQGGSLSLKELAQFFSAPRCKRRIKQAGLVAERVQELLEQMSDDKLPRLTLSIGVACLETAMPTWEALFSQADKAMYEAKKRGKNRYFVCETRSVA